MRTILKTIGLLILGLVALLLLYPSQIQPEAWAPGLNPGFSGEYEANDKLAKITRISTGEYEGPEDVAVDSSGNIYCGTVHGEILRFDPEGKNMEVFANTKGRPLGLHFDKYQHLIVGDADKGLLSIDSSGIITVLTTESNGKPFKFTDDVEVAENGMIYFSDASDRFGIHDFKLDLLEHGSNGRLLSYNPTTKETTTLLTGLYFANGIAVSQDQSFVLVNETAKYRITRYWIAGEKKGQHDIFLDNFPGFPDGVSLGGDGIFWIAFTAPRDATLDGTLPYPFARNIIAKLPEFLKPQAKPYGFVLGVNQSGKIIYNLQDPQGALSQIASTQQFQDRLYFGSLKDHQFGMVELSLIK